MLCGVVTDWLLAGSIGLDLLCALNGMLSCSALTLHSSNECAYSRNRGEQDFMRQVSSLLKNI